MVKRTRETDPDEPTQEYQVVPGPAEEAEGTIHPAEDPQEELPQLKAADETPHDDIVDQVLRGEWGSGQDRRLRLQQAGHSPNEVQREIVRRANKR